MIWNNKSILKYIEIKNSTDPINEIREDCRQMVLDALDKGWSGPPFNPLELATILNIPVTPNEGVPDARIIPTGVNKYIIEYNPFQKESRVNFSIAHELAHTLFPDCADQIRNRAIENEEDKQLELLCNIGASEILLPYGQFTQDAASINPEIEGLLQLSNKYKASLIKFSRASYSSLFALSTSKSSSVNSECNLLFCNKVKISSIVSSVNTICPFSKLIFQPLFKLNC